MFEIKLLICIKMDLALIIYNGWCAMKPNQTIDGSLTGITTPCQSRPKSNGNEIVPHTVQTPRAIPSLSDEILSQTQKPPFFVGGDKISVF